MAETMAPFVELFAKIMGDTTKKTEVVLIDKRETEHSNIRQCLPSARMLLCHFHALQAFGRCPSLADAQLASKYFKKCLYAKTEGKFQR